MNETWNDIGDDIVLGVDDAVYDAWEKQGAHRSTVDEDKFRDDFKEQDVIEFIDNLKTEPRFVKAVKRMLAYYAETRPVPYIDD